MEKMNLSKTVLDMRFMKKTKIEMQKVIGKTSSIILNVLWYLIK